MLSVPISTYKQTEKRFGKAQIQVKPSAIVNIYVYYGVALVYINVDFYMLWVNKYVDYFFFRVYKYVYCIMVLVNK